MTKHDDILRRAIEVNRLKISDLLNGSNSLNRLNNFNWLRHELSYTEPRTLFYLPQSQQMPYLDYNHMKNLGDAYDHIIEHIAEEITPESIQKMHRILCNGTHIDGGIYRTSGKILEINVNGAKYHAPDYTEIPYRMNEIIYTAHNASVPCFSRAINAHYELIMLQPFDDFNKRTARIVMNWILLRGGYRPIIFNASKDKQLYKEAIIARANGDGREYTRYMQRCMKRTQEQVLKVLQRSKIFQF